MADDSDVSPDFKTSGRYRDLQLGVWRLLIADRPVKKLAENQSGDTSLVKDHIETSSEDARDSGTNDLASSGMEVARISTSAPKSVLSTGLNFQFLTPLQELYPIGRFLKEIYNLSPKLSLASLAFHVVRATSTAVNLYLMDLLLASVRSI